jgi:unsaturated chondroitin disaccharide hydrolase
MIHIDYEITPTMLFPAVQRLFTVSGEKIKRLEKNWNPEKGTPVFTIKGKYTSRGWTEWTQGFQFGAAIYQFEVTRDGEFLDIGRRNTVDFMASHITHIGVHDHGFNNVSTYGNLLRLMATNQMHYNPWEKNFYDLALKATGAVQASRWTQLTPELGYIYSFNGPHSLFADTIRSLRALAVSHLLGHKLMGEMDRPISLLSRLLQHAETTARYAVFYGEGRDAYDLRGRTAHESIFNVNDGAYRCPNSQQGYSPFSTWTRGLAWILCGYPEQIEFLETLPDADLAPYGGKKKVLARFLQVAEAVADFYLQYTPIDGIPYWDTGAPGLAYMGDYLDRPAVQRARTGRQQRRNHRRAGPAPPRQLSQAHRSRGAGRALLPGRIDRRTYPLPGALPLHRSHPRRPDPPLHLPPPEPMGLHPDRTAGAVRRSLHVGRLPRPRTRRDAQPRGHRSTRSPLLRYHISDSLS